MEKIDGMKNNLIDTLVKNVKDDKDKEVFIKTAEILKDMTKTRPENIKSDSKLGILEYFDQKIGSKSKEALNNEEEAEIIGVLDSEGVGQVASALGNILSGFKTQAKANAEANGSTNSTNGTNVEVLTSEEDIQQAKKAIVLMDQLAAKATKNLGLLEEDENATI
mmetsp:Transcript_12842/g.10981  ORF Transcript_12842/g.10981 Transcript_12842/m.10981 type:complete len:165 (-) Transcript_12842:1895-2389(-)|eukprot:CAMPEP_0114578578 /NCGR_PEP_ID=MMETSP0125-20121206/3096_1 /TAXON_ID=485358 ORGANISM="Aristerostoma sp., Strain ATCC 50986" /NCGR_SAMPLE_ID=MMETSP0125 /ASSEMBLY_ACC=CAM_ASM_000245 /LENGTH=164 /DNA_ID=CAMNT_0001768745 /DNA_START=1426 /DNA_END=1920 /DNA_ORIENTATION=-